MGTALSRVKTESSNFIPVIITPVTDFKSSRVKELNLL